MPNDPELIWKDDKAQRFAAALAALDDVGVMQDFLRDVMTEKEIREMSARLEAARMLRDGETYTAVIRETKLSSRTVARISDWLQNGRQGYQAALTALHHDHMPPARGE